MWPDMPMPGTREFGRWFDQQDPETQDQIIFNFGLSDANTPMGGSVGTDQPEIGAQNFGMLNQLSPPPVINSKGVVQPSGTEQVQKQTNLFQDQLSLGTDNMLAAIAGQFAPTAFEPTYKPQGNPVQATGLRQLQSLANTGGWEGFMAAQMLPLEYGGGGMSPGQAKGALMAALKVPDDADQEALNQREELRASLTPRYETTPLKPGETPPTKDLMTDQGIVNSFDFSDVDNVSRQWQSDLAKDPVIGYTDPQTGLSYAGALAEKTPTMEWFDKYGLPYANKRYDDPDEIRRMQDAVAPVAPGQLEAEDLRNQQALAANAKARGALGEATSQDELLRRAYAQVMKPSAGIGAPVAPVAPAAPVAPSMPGNPGALRPLGLQPGGLLGPPSGNPGMGAGITPPEMPLAPTRAPAMQAPAMQAPTAQAPMTPSRFLMDIDPTGRLLGLSNNQAIPGGGLSDKTKMGAGMSGQVNFDFGQRGATLPAARSPLEALGLKPLVPGSNRRVMTAEDLAPAAQRVAMARKAAAATVPGIQAASKSSPDAFARQMAQARLIGLSLAGRTPLADTLSGRMMAARAAGVYG